MKSHPVKNGTWDPPVAISHIAEVSRLLRPVGPGTLSQVHLRALALTTRTDQRLGKPLPNQLPNLPQTHPKAKKNI